MTQQADRYVTIDQLQALEIRIMERFDKLEDRFDRKIEAFRNLVMIITLPLYPLVLGMVIFYANLAR